MLKTLYSIYNIQFSSETLDTFHKRISTRLSNILFYLVCKFQIGAGSNSINEPHNLNSSDKYIVSLTSFPKRINYVWMTIESILRQTSKPDAIILWLAKDQFEGKHALPKELLKLEKRGLQICFCGEDLKPHKKYYYTLKNYPKANIITVDDDVIYSPTLVATLKNYHIEYPGSICSVISRIITVEEDTIKPYKGWELIKENVQKSHKFLQIGVGGVLYPPNALHKEVLNKKMLKQKALGADDLWLKVMALKNNTEIVSLGNIYPRTFLPIIIKDNVQLMDSNIGQGENDKIFNKLLDHYALREKVLRILKR